jgi:lactobin A/cerein 7B family class IIb bacteriocin
MMNELNKNELQQISGGGIGIGLLIGAGLYF